MLRHVFLSSAIAAAALLVFASTAGAQQADVIHWWTSGSESKAVNVFAQEYDRRGGHWLDSAVVGGPAARAAATNRIAGGNPPTATMWNVGVAVRQLAEQGLLVNLDDLAQAGNWAKVLPPLILKNVSYDGHVIAVPVDIHGGNWMFWSVKVFKDLNLEPPKTWDEFLAMAPKIKAAGFTPLALGGQPSQENWLFVPILIGVGGKDLQRKIFADHDAKSAASDGVLRSFETFGKLRQYVDAGSPNRKWNDTLLLLENNQAAIQILGDWGKGEFNAAGKKLGVDYGCAMAPGNATAYEMVVDVFAFPKSKKADSLEAQRKLAGVMMDPAVQVAFNRFKGALPARLDADVGTLDPCAQIGAKVLEGGPENQLPNVALAFSPDTEGQFNDLLTQFWNNPSMTAADATKQFAAIIANADN